MPGSLVTGSPSEDTNAKQQSREIAAGINNEQLKNTPNIVMPGEVVQNTQNNTPSGAVAK